MEAIRERQQVFGEHQTDMNTHTHILAVIVEQETTWKQLEENNKTLGEVQTGINADTHPLVVIMENNMKQLEENKQLANFKQL